MSCLGGDFVTTLTNITHFEHKIKVLLLFYYSILIKIAFAWIGEKVTLTKMSAFKESNYSLNLDISNEKFIIY